MVSKLWRPRVINHLYMNTSQLLGNQVDRLRRAMYVSFRILVRVVKLLQAETVKWWVKSWKKKTLMTIRRKQFLDSSKNRTYKTFNLQNKVFVKNMTIWLSYKSFWSQILNNYKERQEINLFSHSIQFLLQLEDP